MRLCIIGHGGHGKDTLAQIWADYFGLKFQSSSWVACRELIFDKQKDYDTLLECYINRRNHRKFWFDTIAEYNTPDKTKLARKVLQTSDCYVGIRSKEELQSCIDTELFDHTIWVDASARLPEESSESMTLTKDMSSISINNNGTLEEFHEEALALGVKLFKKNPITHPLRLFAIEHSETEWIAAKTNIEALQIYNQFTSVDLWEFANTDRIVEVPRHEWALSGFYLQEDFAENAKEKNFVTFEEHMQKISSPEYISSTCL